MTSQVVTSPKIGLRQRQKVERHNFILNTARKRFAKLGFELTKVDDIAEEVGMSSVTIFNYFGSKAGLLLALVRESDERLISQLQTFSTQKHKTAVDAVIEFARIIRENATLYLQKPLWRQVLAASIIDKSGEFNEQYQTLDIELKQQLAYLLKVLQKNKKLPEVMPIEQVCETIFIIQNTRFVRYMSSDTMLDSEVDRLVKQDVCLILNQFLTEK